MFPEQIWISDLLEQADLWQKKGIFSHEQQIPINRALGWDIFHLWKYLPGGDLQLRWLNSHGLTLRSSYCALERFLGWFRSHLKIRWILCSKSLFCALLKEDWCWLWKSGELNPAQFSRNELSDRSQRSSFDIGMFRYDSDVHKTERKMNNRRTVRQTKGKM